MMAKKGRAMLYPEDFILHTGRVPSSPKVDHKYDWELKTGANVPAYRTGSTATSLLVIGDVWDPRKPHVSQSELIDRVANRHGTEELDDAFRSFGGRFIVIRLHPRPTVWLDACGLFELFYGIDAQGKVVCASRPELVNGYLGQTKPSRVAVPSLDSNGWLPGRLTQYRHVFQLLPHHRLDLLTGKVSRTWPRRSVSCYEYQDCLQQVSGLLRGMAQAVIHRHPKSVVALTAGLDSRVSWAAFCVSTNRPTSFTFRYPGMLDDHKDICIPPRIVSHTGGSHQLLNTPSVREGDHSFQNHFGPDVALVNSNLLEIARAFYEFPSQLFRASVLRAYERMPNHPAINHELTTILDELRELQRQTSWDARDLFYWEQRVAHWAARTWRRSPVRKVNLFNCQELIELMLSVSREHRIGSQSKFFKDLLESLVPGITNVPINPPDGLTERVKTQLKHGRVGSLSRAMILNIMGKVGRSRQDSNVFCNF